MGRLAKILLIDDSVEVEMLVKNYLPLFDIVRASSLAEAKHAIETESFILILLDLGLPDGDGIELCRWLMERKQQNDCPIIMVTARDSKAEVVQGLDAGADDYLTKPFHGPELRARVEACLRRRAKAEFSKTYQVGGLELDTEFQRCFITSNDSKTDLKLTPTEFRILYNMVLNQEKLFSRNELSKKIWEESGVHVNSRAIDCHMAHLRKKLGDYRKYICASYGKGYYFQYK